MTTKSLGNLRRVDLREVWDNEAGSFAPWLAQEDNIKLPDDAKLHRAFAPRVKQLKPGEAPEG
jgi:hypothetical protein